MSSRRAILKLIGMAPAAASSAASQLAPMLSSPAVMAAGALAGQTAGLPGPSYGVLGPLLGKQLQRLKRDAEDEMYAKRAIRVGGLDGDISSMRSTSRAWKERQQHERDIADSKLLRYADSVMWGDQ